MSERTGYFGRLKVNFDKKREGFEIFRKDLWRETGEYRCIAYNEIALGQHFLDFLENSQCGLGSVVERYKGIYRYLDKDYLNMNMIEETMDFIRNIYAELSDLHVFWRTVLYENNVLYNYHWFDFYRSRTYLNHDAADITEAIRYERMSHFWENTRRAIQHELLMMEELSAFVSSMINAVSFCLDNTKFSAFQGLHSRQRAYIYQMAFDKNFMNGLPVQVHYKLGQRRKEFTNYTGFPAFSENDRNILLSSLLSNANYYDLMDSDNAQIDFKPLIDKVQKQSIEMTVNIDLVKMEDIYTLCMYSFSSLISQDIHVHPCRNCGKFFSPYNRSDEIYCARIQANQKSCRDNYYEKQMQNDEVSQYYRTAYKRHNAYKQRNLSNKPSAEKEFKTWCEKAKKALKKVKDGKISADEFKKIMDE